MLFQPSNISPSTLSGIGAGTVDVTLGITVSWQVNGDTPMTAYQITIYQNDTASTQKYTTGKITLGTPFQPHDKNGNPQFFSTQISAANLASAGVVNGYANGYKLLITQWWTANDYVTQTSASVFNALANPTLTIDAISGTSISETITATYAQAQGDPISTVEWIFAVAGSESDPIKKTGIVTTQILSLDVDGLMDGTTYSVECNVVTASGVYISTGFIQFTVSYSITTEQIDATLGQLKNSNGVYLSWGMMSGAGINWYTVYRKESGVPYLKKVGTTSSNIREIVDYGVGSNSTAQYVIIGLSNTTPVSVATTQNVQTQFWDYSILLCYTDNDGLYHVDSEYRFGLNVETGAVSNNNEPTLQRNFTRYPNRQPISSLFKSGQLKSYIGRKSGLNSYVDSLKEQDSIFAISTSTMKKFLKTRKGEVLMVETSSPISMSVLDGSNLQPLTATISWAEVGDAKNASIVSEPTDAFFPVTVEYTYAEASGPIASFISLYGGEPLKSLTASISPVQDLHGYDSPWPGGGGKNKWSADASFSKGDSATYVFKQISEIPAGTYTISGLFTTNSPDNKVRFRFMTNSGVIVSLDANTGKRESAVFTTDESFTDIRCYGQNNTTDRYAATFTDVQIEAGNEATPYAPYSNICPISGRTGLNVYRTGKNFLPIITETVTINGITATPQSDGGIALSGTSSTTTYIDLDTNFDSTRFAGYLFSGLPDTGTWGQSSVCYRISSADSRTGIQDFTRTNGTYNSQVVRDNGSGLRFAIRIPTNYQLPEDFVIYPMLRAADTSNTFEPYNGTTNNVDWTDEAGTVYGGTLDTVSGKLTVNRASIVFDGSNDESWAGTSGSGWYVGANSLKKSLDYTGLILCDKADVTPYQQPSVQFSVSGYKDQNNTYPNQNWIYYINSSISSISDLRTFLALNSLQIVYELATPIEYTLTPQTVSALVGQNYLWADTGDVSVTYVEKKELKSV